MQTFFKYLFLITCFLYSKHSNSQNKSDNKILGIYIYQFIKNTNRIESEKLNKNEYRVVFLGSDNNLLSTFNQYKRTYEGKKIGNKTVKVLNFTELDQLEKVDFLFVNKQCNYTSKEIKNKIKNYPTIHVGYRLPYGDPMINLIVVDNRISFNINETYASQKKITFAPTLKKLATNNIATQEEWDSILNKFEHQIKNSPTDSISLTKQELNEFIGDYQDINSQLEVSEEEAKAQRALYKKNQKEIIKQEEKIILHELVLEKHVKEIKQQKKHITQQENILSTKISAIEEHESTISSQKYIIYLSSVFLIIFLLASVLIFRSYRAKNKAHKEIELQKEIVDEKNREILDSINYAKRIQSAILPPTKLVKEYLKQSFILYKPKDIVAGDFYWLEHRDNKILFAAADCTGHGVPGAMVSVVCNNGLNRSVREHKLTDPGQILDKTREIVIAEFEKSEDEVKDGMDIALCSLEGNTLKYAGAHNPLWIIRNGEVLETKANKQPIGKFDKQLPYTTHTFELEKGDSIYIFSDGYVDQFGGEKGKKFKSKAFRSLLLSIQDKTMEEQRVLIDEAFETWRGSLEQIDDVCVIGVRI